MINIKLIDDYHKASDAYEAAKAGIGCRVETFTRFLVAEQVLLTCMGRVQRVPTALRPPAALPRRGQAGRAPLLCIAEEARRWGSGPILQPCN